MSARGNIKPWILAFVGAASLGFGTLIGVGCAVNANVCPFKPEKPLTTTDGRELYLARCVACHGLQGQGGRGPALRAGKAASLSFEDLRGKIEKGRPFMGMPAFKLGSRALTQAQIDAVTTYVMSLRGSR